MTKPIQSPHLFLLMIIFILLNVAAGDSYTPVEDITVKCGYSGDLFNEYDQRNWSGDINSKFSPIEVVQAGANTSVFREAPHESFSDYQVPYTTARLSYHEFTYRFKLTKGQKFIRLYFNPVSYPDFDRYKSLFSVQTGGYTLLRDFSASVTADASGVETVYREFCVNIEEEQNLEIRFSPSTTSSDSYAFINGIEIVSMPYNLYYTPAQSNGVDYIGNESNFRIESSFALETVYRMNIGGRSLVLNSDTGMYRNWYGFEDEQHYLDDLSLTWSVLPENVSLELNFSKIAEYSAPKAIYQVGRSMGMNKIINKSYNLTWGFPVDSMFDYLVRLHFCEFQPEITEPGDRVFLIYMANQTAEEGADIISWSGGNGIPIYRDYVVSMPGSHGNQKKVSLAVALQANPHDSMTVYNDAILNGLEIFKISDLHGNLAGPNPDPPPYIPPSEDITIQCGSYGEIFNHSEARRWIGDTNSSFSPIEDATYASIVREAPQSASPSSSSVRQVPYTTARLSRNEFSYIFSVTTGRKFVRLYFNPVSYGDDFHRSKALFSVKARGFTLLYDFNTSVTADSSGLKTLYREFCLNIEEGEQSLNITFTPSRASPEAYAFINGIEIVSMPDNLYYTAVHNDGIAYVGTNKDLRIENNTVLEMVYRMNIGGASIFQEKDTGMHRNWDGILLEERFLDALSLRQSVLLKNVSIDLNFSIPEYAAPEDVYKTGRSTNVFNLTWVFPVDPTFFYLVRLHFCEFEPGNTKVRDRMFLIHMANQIAEENADIIKWSGGHGRPVYKDYLVLMRDGSPGTLKKVNLSIALQPIRNAAILNGLEIFKLSDQDGNLAGPNTTATPSSSRKHNTPKTKSIHMIAIVVGLASGVVLLSVLFGFLIFRRRRKVKFLGSFHRKTKSTQARGSSFPPFLCRYFSLAEIKAATQNFNQSFIIGVGGFGNVYKGYIDGGAIPVAIKRLKPESSQGAREFKTEIELLSQLRHRHLVSLIGYCTDEEEMVLVYDYMPRGTLADHLYHTENPPLSWEQRLQICIGAAQGLRYLHSGAKVTIIHRDVKSTNILLDEKWVAKVSDFGLSKMGTTSTSKTHISTAVKGSFGYLDPEYYRRQRLTDKSDVYSFGVVLCEVLCARPAVVHTVELRQMNLAEWAKSCHNDGELDQIIDPKLRGKIETECLNKFVEIAMSCMIDNGIERPSMDEVVRGLEFTLQIHQNCAERSNEVAFIDDSAAKFASSEQISAANESIQRISVAIFSEINDPNGR